MGRARVALPEVGGQYVYLQRAFHPVVGFLYGVALLFIINGGSLAAVSMLFAVHTSNRSLVSLGPVGVQVVAAGTLVTLTAINAVGVRAGKWTNNILMTAKVAGMVALVGLAFAHGSTPATTFAVTERPEGASLLQLMLTALVRSCLPTAGGRVAPASPARSRIPRATCRARTSSASSASWCSICRSTWRISGC